ncbi:MAG TPA: hypothetical protein PK993_03890 [Clostridia bacterium]|nr:hypothetical protein [Clostridia bacterium]
MEKMTKDESIKELINKIKETKKNVNYTIQKEETEDLIIINLKSNYLTGVEIYDISELISQYWKELDLKEWFIENQNKDILIKIYTNKKEVK